MDHRELVQEIQSLQERARRLNEQLQTLSEAEISTLPALQPTLEGL